MPEQLDLTAAVQRPNAIGSVDGPYLLRGLMLPLPPSANSYWRTRVIIPKGKYAKKPFSSTYVGEEGVAYSQLIAELSIERRFRFNTSARLLIEIVVCPRDRLTTDIDNRVKPLLDALKNAEVFQDDEQLDRIVVERGPILPGGKVVVGLQKFTPDYQAVLDQAWRR